MNSIYQQLFITQSMVYLASWDTFGNE